MPYLHRFSSAVFYPVLLLSVLSFLAIICFTEPLKFVSSYKTFKQKLENNLIFASLQKLDIETLENIVKKSQIHLMPSVVSTPWKTASFIPQENCLLIEGYLDDQECGFWHLALVVYESAKNQKHVIRRFILRASPPNSIAYQSVYIEGLLFANENNKTTQVALNFFEQSYLDNS